MMRMIGNRRIMACAFAVAALVSCSENLDVQLPSNGEMKVTAYAGETAKTALQQNKDIFDVIWSEGDKILIGGQEFTLVGEGGSREGEFVGPQLEDGEYDAYFATTDGSIPTTQNFTAGRIGNAPMSAKMTVSSGVPGPISFKNIGGLLRITLKNIQKAPIKNIAITGNSSTMGVRTLLDCGVDDIRLEEDGTEFYIAMPEGSYSSVSIEVSDGKQTITKTLDGTKRLNISRSQITPASFTVLFSGKYPKYHKGHEYVDLGLPSGVMWATCNLGADKAYQGGGRYVWKEGEAEKALASEWGGNWRLPTLEEVKELTENAEPRPAYYQGDDFDESQAGSGRPKGHYFVKNGRYIFFPFLSYPDEHGISCSGVGYYWTSSYDTSSEVKYPYIMCLHDYSASITQIYSIFHYSVRPVLNSSR